MAECQRCGRDTDRRTLADEPLCAECAEWVEEHTESRDTDPLGLGELERYARVWLSAGSKS